MDSASIVPLPDYRQKGGLIDLLSAKFFLNMEKACCTCDRGNQKELSLYFLEGKFLESALDSHTVAYSIVELSSGTHIYVRRNQC